MEWNVPPPEYPQVDEAPEANTATATVDNFGSSHSISDLDIDMLLSSNLDVFSSVDEWQPPIYSNMNATVEDPTLLSYGCSFNAEWSWGRVE